MKPIYQRNQFFGKVKWITISVVLAVAAMALYAQVPQNFTNLDFESARIASGTQPGTTVPMSSALPGWNVSISQPNHPLLWSAISTATYDSSNPTQGSFSVYDSHSKDGINPLQGNFSAVMTTGSQISSFDLGESGLLPTGTKSLLIEAKSSLLGIPLDVFMQNQTIPYYHVQMVPLETAPDYTLYGGDISSLAGQWDEMDIRFPDFSALGPGQQIELDAITFSPDAINVPESKLPLALVAALFAGVMAASRVLSSKEEAQHA